MGYIVLLVLGIAAIVVLAAALMSGRRRPAGRTWPGKDITPKQPAANEPTPGASDTAPPGQAEQAQRHTPPA